MGTSIDTVVKDFVGTYIHRVLVTDGTYTPEFGMLACSNVMQ